MPAISADTVALPRIPTVDPTAADRPVVSVTTAPSGFEGEGFPVRRAFAGVDLAVLDPFVHMDQMGEVDYAPGEPKGHPLAPSPRVRDRHLHARRRLPPPGLQRRRWADHRRRHAVDDGGSRLANMAAQVVPLPALPASAAGGLSGAGEPRRSAPRPPARAGGCWHEGSSA
jgi:hypothetical protein